MTDSGWVPADSGDTERWRQAAASARARIAAFPDVPADPDEPLPGTEPTSTPSTTRSSTSTSSSSSSALTGPPGANLSLSLPAGSAQAAASGSAPGSKPAPRPRKKAAGKATADAPTQTTPSGPAKTAAQTPSQTAAQTSGKTPAQTQAQTQAQTSGKAPARASTTPPTPATAPTGSGTPAGSPASTPSPGEEATSILDELAGLATGRASTHHASTHHASTQYASPEHVPAADPAEPPVEAPGRHLPPVSVGAATAAAEVATQVVVTKELTEPRGSVSSYPLTAADFSESAVLGRRGQVARFGWRNVLGALTNGRLRLPPSPYEVRRNQLIGRVRTPIEGTRRIVVMSRKGGVGKTTVTVGVGATFAALRGDRVVAVDANPDAGNLAHRIAGDCQRTITDLLADSGRVRSFAMMRGYTSQCTESRLEVLASDDDARIAQALDRDAYRQVVSLLDHFYNLILLDTGTGILDSANQGLLAEADQLVLVVRPALDGARAGAQTLDWLEEHGHGDLVSSAVVVINGVERDSDPIVGYTRKHFASRCAKVTTVPWDRALESGGRTTLSSLNRRTRAAFVDVAAALADGFSEAPLARTSRDSATHEFRFTPVDPVLD